MGEEKGTKRVLAVDDDADDLCMIQWALEGAGYEIDCAKDVPTANRLVHKALQTGRRYDAAFVDLKIRNDSGADFARRLMDIIVDIGVCIITGHHNPAVKILKVFHPDETIIKTGRSLAEDSTLLEAAKRLLEPKRINTDPLDVQLNLWDATSHFYGINDLSLLERRSVTEEEGITEKFTTDAMDGQWVSTVVYPGVGKKPLAPQSTIGCTLRCRNCNAWKHLKGPSGESVPYIRPLTDGELFAQIYLVIIKSPRMKELFSNESKENLTVNFSGPGDCLVNNLENTMTVVKRLLKIEKPIFDIILTSVGDEKQLQKYIDRYIDTPRLTHYWSVDSLDPRFRCVLKPGTYCEDEERSEGLLERLRDLYEEIARRTGRPVTASFTRYKRTIDTTEEGKSIFEFLHGRPFRTKVQPGCPGSMGSSRDITWEETLDFEQLLIDMGLEDVRARKVFAARHLCGCGTTNLDFLLNAREND